MTTIKTYPSHYSAVKKSFNKVRTPLNTIEIEDLVGILLEEDELPPFISGYIVTYKDKKIISDGVYLGRPLITTCGLVSFSKSDDLFPTKSSNRFGAIIEHLGKTFHISYNDTDGLIIEHDGMSYGYYHPDATFDGMAIYDVVFEGIIPSGEDIE